MSELTRREREKLERRMEILEAAQKRFFKYTYDEVSMEDIANDVELAKGTLYLYYKNKQSLFFSVVIKGMSMLRDVFKQTIKKEKCGKDKVLSIARAFYDYIQQNADYYRLNLASRGPRFAAMIANNEIDNAQEYIKLTIDLLNLTKKAISAGIKDKTLKSDLDPYQTTLFIGASIEAAAYVPSEYEMLLNQLKITKKQYFDHSIKIILNGIEGVNSS